MLNIVLFKFTSGIRSDSQDLVKQFSRKSKFTTLNSSGSFMIAEALLLFVAYNCVMLPLLGKYITPPAKVDSLWLAFLTSVMIWEISYFSLYFSALTEMVACL